MHGKSWPRCSTTTTILGDRWSVGVCFWVSAGKAAHYINISFPDRSSLSIRHSLPKDCVAFIPLVFVWSESSVLHLEENFGSLNKSDQAEENRT